MLRIDRDGYLSFSRYSFNDETLNKKALTLGSSSCRDVTDGGVVMCITNGNATIYFDSATLTDKAMITLSYWIADEKPRRTIMQDVLSASSPKIFGEPRQAIHALTQLMSDRSIGKRRFERTPITKLSPRNEAYLREFFATIGVDDVFDNLESIVERLQTFEGLQYIVVHVHPEAGRLIVGHVAAGYQVLDKSWLERAVGQRVQDQIDYDYGCWVAETYHDVYSHQQPNLDRVKAEVRKQGGSVVRAEYSRVVYPARMKNGQSLVLSVSQLLN